MDIYIRVSDLGDREEEESTEIYEAQCREWADRHDVSVGVVVEDTNVSGSVATNKRGLKKLIERVEQGESAGIITPYLDRFGRDLIEGAVALKRIVDAGGKLIAVRDGFDSSAPGSELVFNLRMAIAQDFLSRNKDNRQAQTDRAVREKIWLWPRVPFGYEKDEDRRLVIVEDEAEVVREMFKRRSQGVNVIHLKDWLNAEHVDLVKRSRDRNRRRDETGTTMTRGAVRSMLENRAYVGEMTAQNRGKGPKVIKDAHPPILTEAEFLAGQKTEGQFFARTGLAEGAELRGLVYCAGCGKRCKVGASGPKGKRHANYVCNTEDCPAGAAIKAALLDSYATDVLFYASTQGDPHIAAIIEDDALYESALADVEEARAELEDFTNSVKIQRALGIDAFAAGITTRREAVATAIARFEEVKRTASSVGTKLIGTPPDSTAAVEAALTADRNATFISKVLVRRSETRGRAAQSPRERVEVYFIGADEPAAAPPAFDPAAPGAAPSYAAAG